MGLLPTEWVKIIKESFQACSSKGFMNCHRPEKSDMKVACAKIEDFGMHIGLLGSSLNTQFQVSLAIPKPGSSGSTAGGKNRLRSLRLDASYFLRSEDPQSSRLVLWRYADLPGRGDPSGLLLAVRESETRKVGLAGRLSLLYQAVCFLRGPSLPRFEHPGRSQRVALGLEDRQILGEAIHARAGTPRGYLWAEGAGH